MATSAYLLGYIRGRIDYYIKLAQEMDNKGYTDTAGCCQSIINELKHLENILQDGAWVPLGVIDKAIKR